MTLKPEHIVEALNKKTFDEIDPDEVLKHYGYKPEEVRCNGVGIGVYFLSCFVLWIVPAVCRGNGIGSLSFGAARQGIRRGSCEKFSGGGLIVGKLVERALFVVRVLVRDAGDDPPPRVHVPPLKPEPGGQQAAGGVVFVAAFVADFFKGFHVVRSFRSIVDPVAIVTIQGINNAVVAEIVRGSVSIDHKIDPVKNP